MASRPDSRPISASRARAWCACCAQAACSCGGKAVIQRKLASSSHRQPSPSSATMVMANSRAVGGCMHRRSAARVTPQATRPARYSRILPSASITQPFRRISSSPGLSDSAQRRMPGCASREPGVVAGSVAMLTPLAALTGRVR